ncbi:MAG: ester cyclase, partial [Bryobacterales bacterium]|nr:ester cyclase [Bryobacterales bacterium]
MNLQQQREAIVRRHMEAENRHDVDATIDTFHQARYEVMPFGAPSDGADAVRGLLGALMAAFPDFHVAETALYHSATAVIVETRMTGTHRGDWMGMPPSGRAIDLMAACFFLFDGPHLLCERVYFDNA